MNIESTINQKLSEALKPIHLQVVNESHMHNVPANSETHFKVTVVSAEFDGKRAVARHQSVYSVLQDELKGSVHALAIHAYSPSEWQATDTVPDSPECLGGES